MYSSLVQSRVTVPSTLSRNDCAAAHWAASKRPAMTTTSSAPKSIASILPPRFCCRPCRRRVGGGFSKRDPAPPLFLRILVRDGIHEPANQMQPQAPRFAPFNGQGGVGD